MKTNLLWLAAGALLAVLWGQTISKSDKRIIASAANSSLENVVKVSIHLADLNDFDAMNEVYRAFFKSDYPARTTVHAVLRTGRRIEIDCIARGNQ